MRAGSDGSHRLNLKWFYLPVLMLIGLMMVFGTLLLSSHLTAQNQFTAALVSTNQQRLTVQTIAFVSSQLVAATSNPDRAALRDQLNRSVEALASQRTLMADGDLPSEIAALYFDAPMQIDLYILTFIDAVRALMKDPAPEADTPAYREVIRLQPILQTGINAVSNAYQSIYTANYLLTRSIGLGVLLGILVTLVGAVIFIFRPLEQLLKRSELHYRQTIIETQSMFAALGASESRFRTLTNAAPVGIFMTDPQGKRIFSNEYWCELSGITEAESLGDGWRKVLHPDERERIAGAWRQGIAQQKLVNLEYRYVRPDGKVIWVQGTGKPVYDAEGSFQGYLGAVMDITARVQAETALRERERFIDRITATIPDIVYVYDLIEARNVYSNQEVTQTLGYTPAEVQTLGSSLLERLIHPDDLPLVYENNRRLESASDDDVFEVEYRIKRADGEWRWLYSRERAMLRDPNGKVIQKLGIAQDITERKNLQEQLQASEERLRLIAETVPDLIFRADHAGSITYANPAFQTVLGLDPQQIIGQIPLDLMHPDDRQPVLERFRAATAAQESHLETEFRVQRPDGTFIWIEASGTFIYNQQGQFESSAFVARDITDRKHLEEELRASEERIRLITDRIPDMVTQSDAEGRVTFVNPALRTILGYSPETLLNNPGMEFIHPDDLGPLMEMVAASLTANTANICTEIRLRHADGHYLWAETTGTLLRDAQSVYTGTIFITRDITERRELQDALRKSEARYRTIVETAQEGIWLVDTAGNTTYVNPKMAEILGVAGHEILGHSIFEFMDETERQKAQRNFERREGTLEQYEFCLKHKTGSDVWVSMVTNPILDDQGQVIALLAMVTDITESKQVRDALQASEERLGLSIQVGSIGIFDHNHRDNSIYWSPEMRRIYGVGPDEPVTLESGRSAVYSEDAERIHEAVLRAWDPSSDGTFEVEYRIIDRSGIMRWISTRSRTFFEGEGDARHPVRTIGATIEFTDRMRVEEALRANEEHLRFITNNAQDMISQLDEMGCYVYASPSFHTTLGYDPGSLIGKWGVEMIHPEDVERMTAIYQEAITTHPRDMKTELRLRHIDGYYIWVESTGTFLYDDSGNYKGGVFVSRDITERKRLQEELRSSEEQMRLITDNVPDLISRVDEAGYYTFVSPSYQTVLGYGPSDLVGLYAGDIVHPDDIEAVTTAFYQARQSCQQLRTEVRMRHADGHYVQFETIGTFLFNKTGQYLGGVYIARDITERSRLQEALIEQEKLTTALEKEQELNQLKNRMMLRIDHEFRTPLTVIRSMAYTLDAYADRLSAEQRHVKVDAIQRQVERIVLMLDAIRSVLTGAYADQRANRVPVRLLDLCRAAVRDVDAYFGTSDRLSINVPEDLIIDVDPQTLKEAIYKVVVNALLYSNPPDLVHVTAELIEREVELRVIDCGVGILENELPRIFEPFFRGSNIGEVSGIGLGLTIAKASVESYGGRIAVDSQPDTGTTVRIRLPTAE